LIAAPTSWAARVALLTQGRAGQSARRRLLQERDRAVERPAREAARAWHAVGVRGACADRLAASC